MSVTTWIRGVCQHIDTTGKNLIVSCSLFTFKHLLSCIFNFKKLYNQVLYTLLYHYANFYDFLSMFATSIKWKRKNEEKSMKKV